MYTEDGRTVHVTSDPSQEMNMGSVLSAIAMHLKNNRSKSCSDPVRIQRNDNQQAIFYTLPAENVDSSSSGGEILVTDVDNVATETVVHTNSVIHSDYVEGIIYCYRSLYQ